MIHIYPVRYILEIQNSEEPEGIHCIESIVVDVCDEGGGPFLAIMTNNLEPTSDYGAYTVSLEGKDIQPLADALKQILEEHE